jgi:hemolysin activation/secretion protein
MQHNKLLNAIAVAALLCVASYPIHAQTPSPSVNAIPNTVEIERQQQAAREAQLKAQSLQPNVNANKTDAPKHNIPTWLPYSPPDTVSQPCFVIQTIDWQGNAGATAFGRVSTQFDWLEAQAMPILNRCVDASTVRGLQDHLGQSLVQAGYVTTRVLIPEQSLAQGRLIITVVPGTVAAHSPVSPAIGAISMLLPTRATRLLNQRDLDHALENARRLASQDKFEIDIAPGAAQGESILQFKSQADPKRWRVNISADDTGSPGTGNHYQLGGTFSYDSPLGLYDALSINLGSNSNFGVHDKHNRSRAVQWTMPYGYALFNIGVNDSMYLQTVAGYGGPVVYSGRSTGLEAGVNVTVHRDATSKDSLSFKLNRKASRSYLEDTEIDVQFKDTTGYELGYARRQTFGDNTVEFSLAQKGNLKRYSNHPGIIVGQPEWSGHTRIHTASLQWTAPFSWQIWNPNNDGAQQKSQFQSQIKWHQAQTAVQASDYFALGGRYSIRGTDGIMSLASDRGWFIRNDVSWTVPSTQTQFYFAYDLGHVSGHNLANLVGDRLSGAALGYKGKVRGFNFDVTYGIRVKAPPGFKSAAHALTAQISYDF